MTACQSIKSHLLLLLRYTLYLLLLYILYDQLRIYQYKRCTFSQPPESHPLPVILLSLGRSGSSVTWDTVSTLTGNTTTIAYEVTGQTRAKSDKFFGEIRRQIGERWAVLRLCSIQTKWPEDAGIIGFQWKPYQNSFTHHYALGAFRDIGLHTSPPIHAIYLTRNPLDRKASNLRHSLTLSSSKLSAHCAINDTLCVSTHKQTLASQGGVNLPVGRDLMNFVKGDRKASEKVSEILGMNGIRYVQVEYEKLYPRGGGGGEEDAEEWKRIFRFLGRGPGEELGMVDVRRTFSMAATSGRERSETIANWEEVVRTLTGTEFEYLLYN